MLIMLILFSSTCAVSCTQTNLHTCGLSTGGTLMPNPFTQLVNHFHNQTTIECSTPTFRMSHQIIASMFEQGYMHTAPSFSISNLDSAPYTFGYNGRAYLNPNGNYQTPYTTIAYTDLISLSGSSLAFLPNHAYQNAPCFNAYD
jgi:hypothetical protein